MLVPALVTSCRFDAGRKGDTKRSGFAGSEIRSVLVGESTTQEKNSLALPMALSFSFPLTFRVVRSARATTNHIAYHHDGPQAMVTRTHVNPKNIPLCPSIKGQFAYYNSIIYIYIYILRDKVVHPRNFSHHI